MIHAMLPLTPSMQDLIHSMFAQGSQEILPSCDTQTFPRFVRRAGQGLIYIFHTGSEMEYCWSSPQSSKFKDPQPCTMKLAQNNELEVLSQKLPSGYEHVEKTRCDIHSILLASRVRLHRGSKTSCQVQ